MLIMRSHSTPMLGELLRANCTEMFELIGVLPQNEMRFAAKRNAFCRKMEGVLPQNGKCFGPKWSAFWPKMETHTTFKLTLILPIHLSLCFLLWSIFHKFLKKNISNEISDVVFWKIMSNFAA